MVGPFSTPSPRIAVAEGSFDYVVSYVRVQFDLSMVSSNFVSSSLVDLVFFKRLGYSLSLSLSLSLLVFCSGPSQWWSDRVPIPSFSGVRFFVFPRQFGIGGSSGGACRDSSTEGSSFHITSVGTIGIFLSATEKRK